MEEIGPLGNHEEAKREAVLERRWRIAVLALSVAGCAAPLGFATAQGTGITQRFITTLVFALGKLLELAILYIGKLVILIVDCVIAVAQYNHFIDAAPVIAGWPLVRDVTNMFVIVILLAIAFGTIIGYQKLHYKGILGKLLLMAVLVNFSKQLIGLLIDFSQIVMLTFVNAFSAAAGGNFTQALKLDKMLSMSPMAQTVDVAGDPTIGDPFLYKAVMAELLAIFFLGMALVLLIIMLIYLLARIVGLWLALIVSPLALFLTAVPQVISGKVHSLASGYWDKLGALIAGGPIMAFFIWLTLATVQGGGFGAFNTANLAGANEVTSAMNSGGFANAIANIEDVATFFISCIMLMMGVDTAVGMTSTLGSGTVTGLVGKVKNVGTRGAKYAAYGGLAAAGGLVAGGMAYGGRKVAGGIDRKLDISGKLGRGIQNVGLKFGAAGIAAEGAKLAQARVRERKERGEVITKSMIGLSPEAKLSNLERIARHTTFDPAGSRAAGLALARNAVTFEGMTELGKRFEAEAKDKGLTNADEISAYRDSKTNDYISTRLEDLRKTAAAEGDEEGVKFVLDKRKDNMSWMSPDTDIADVTSKIAEKTAEIDITKTFTAASFQSAGVADGVLKGTDVLQADGEWNKGSVWYKKLVEPGGMAGKSLDARRLALIGAAAAAGGGMTVSQLLATDEEMKKRRQNFGVEGGRLVRSKDGTFKYVKSGDYQPAEGMRVPSEGPRMTRNAQEVSAGRDVIAARRSDLEAARVGSVGGMDAAAVREAQEKLQEARLETLKAGADMSDVYGVKGGKFANDDVRAEFAQDVDHIQSAARPEFNEYNQIDGIELTQNANASSETRATFVQKVDVTKLATAASDARAHAELSGSPESKAALKNIGNLARAVDAEGTQVAKKIDQQFAKRNLSTKEREERKSVVMDKVIDAAKQHQLAHGNAQAEQAAADNLRKVFADEGIATVPVSMDEAEALLKQQQVKQDANLQNYRSYASSQTAEAVKRVAGAAAAGAVAAGTVVAEGAERRAERVSGAATPSGRKARRMAEAGEAYERGDRSGSDVEPPRPGQRPPRPRPNVPLGPPPSPPPPQPPTVPDLEVPGGGRGGPGGRRG